MVGEQQGVPPRLGPIGLARAGGPGSRRGLTVHHQSHQPDGCGRVHQPVTQIRRLCGWRPLPVAPGWVRRAQHAAAEQG